MLSRRHAIVALALLIMFAVGERVVAAPANTYLLNLPIVTVSGEPALVFVSRQIPPNGSIYMHAAMDMPGVGAHSRFRVAAPGQLLVREAGGALRTLVDGAHPSPATFNLIDVNAPDVSYDGRTIVFAGLPAGQYDPGPDKNPGAWRLYTIGVDGHNLRQVTHSDQNLNLSQFGKAASGLAPYDDTDPAWLPNGLIVFSSTRWPSYAEYDGVRTTNLYVVKPDGGDLRRITSERNGADRPLVDPVTGKIVYSRWWRNQHFALDSLATVLDPSGGLIQKDGLSADRYTEIDGSGGYRDYLWRNAWQAETINPDGTGLALWTGAFRDEAGNDIYGGAFTPSGDLIANFYPMYNMAEAAGFGGLRRYHRGPGTNTPIIGITSLSLQYVHPQNPTSFGIFQGSYAGEPAVLPDGQLVFSWAPDVGQDYGLYRANADGSGLTKLYDRPGTTELRARVILPRALPPVLPGPGGPAPSLLPPTAAAAPYTQDGTFTFDELNVYFNAPVDTDIVSAPAVGSAATIKFFLDQQRTSPGSFEALDWPILLGQQPVSPAGAVQATAPANLPLFEQLRSADGTVPLTLGPLGPNGAAHVAGLNFGAPGAQVRCVGCHAGHSLIPVPASDADAAWTNLAPGSQVFVSSSLDPKYNYGLIDRRVLKGEIWRYWSSSSNQPQNGQWARLVFQVPITVRTVRLYNPRFGDEAHSSLQVHAATVELCADDACSVVLATQTASNLTVAGTNVAFADLAGVRAVRTTLTDVTGTFYGVHNASLAEIEVIGKGE